MVSVGPIFVRANVTSPVRLSGTADVFEAVFFCDVTYNNGAVISTHRIEATAGTGTRGTWKLALDLPPGKAILVFYEVSAKDGAHVNEVHVPIRVVPADRPPTTERSNT